MKVNFVYVVSNSPRLQKGRIVFCHHEGKPQPAADDKHGPMRETGLMDVTAEQMKDIKEGKMTIDFVSKKLKVEIDNERRRGYLNSVIVVSNTATKSEKDNAQVEFDIIKDRV